MLARLVRARSARRQAMTAAARERVADNILDPDRDGDPRPLSAGMILVRVKLWIETHLGEPLSGEMKEALLPVIHRIIGF
jgi:hypothetical protein